MGAEYKPSTRTYTAMRIIGTLIVIVGLISLVNWRNELSLFFKKSEPAQLEMTDIVSYRTTLTGTYLDCLPRNDNFSKEKCIMGMKAGDGSYYALDFALLSQTKPDLKDGDRFTASGLFTPFEMISNDQMRFLIGKGIFSVTDSIKKF